MSEVKILKHSVVITGESFEDCKNEYNRICQGVRKDFGIESSISNLVFSDMTVRDDECIAVFRMPES